MGYFKQKAVLYRKSGTTFTEYATITNFFNFSLRKGLAEAKDSFSMSIINSNNKLYATETYFRVGDMIKIYMWKNTANSTAADMVLQGFINSPTQEITSNGKVINLSGKTVMEYLFTTPIILSTTTAVTAPVVITKIIQEVNRLNLHAGDGSSVIPIQISYIYNNGSGNKIFNGNDLSGTPTALAVTIEQIKSDGTSITDTHSYIAQYWKKAHRLIEEYSQPDMTGDVYSHYAYIDIASDGNLYFHWKARAQSTTTGITEGTQPVSIKTSYTQDIINAIIANVGSDPKGRGNTVFIADYASINNHGAKWKYVGDFRDTSENLMIKEEQTNPASFNDQDRFPTSYNYTTTWGIVCTSDATYTDAIRARAELDVTAKVKGFLRGTTNPKLAVKVGLKGIPTQGLGAYIPHTIASNYLSNENLRLVDLSHSFWQTDAGSEQDKGESTN